MEGPKTVAEQVRAAHADNEDGFEMSEGAVARKWQGTAVDRKDMSELGRVQELRVRTTTRTSFQSCP